MKLDSELTTYIKVNYEWTDKLNIVKEWLSNIKEPTAFDFETASKYYEEEREESLKKFKINNNITNIDYKKAYTSGLSNPNEAILTHIGFSNKDDKGYVIILLDKDIKNYVLNYLITTDILQIWHNSIFDFKHILFYTDRYPKNYEDTRQIAKNRINHVDNFKGSTKLEVLMSKYYGKWKSGIEYTLENVYNKELIEYTAKDVCATYKLYNLMKYKGEI